MNFISYLNKLTYKLYMTIEKDLELMINIQDRLNTYILGEEWVKSKETDWLRATWIECAELMGFLNYKWWKHEEVNLAQAQYELIDIFHFLLSDFIEKKYNIEVLISSYEESFELYKEWKQLKWQHKEYSHLNGVECLVFSIITDGNDNCYYRDFFALCHSLNLSFDDLVRKYLGKNVLNIFRQDKGYKEGTYIKQWPSPLEPNQTLEDNVFLEMFITESEQQNISTSEVFDFIYNRLLSSYPN